MNEVLKELIKGMRELHIRLSEIDDELRLDIKGTKTEISSFQSEYAKEIKTINESIEYLNIQIDKTIKEEIAKIPTPKEIEDLKPLIEKRFSEIAKQSDQLKIDLGQEITKQIESIEVPQGEKGDRGKQGKSATDEQVKATLSDWLDDNLDSLPKDLKGEKGERGLSGRNGNDGEDGISITEVTIKGDYLIVTFSNGEEKRLRLPQQKAMGGGSGNIENFSYDLVDKTVSIPYNQQMVVFGEINITSTLELHGRLILKD